MKKLLLAAIAVFSVAAASNSFADGCGTSYVKVAQQHCAPLTTVVHQPCYQNVVTTQICKPVVYEQKVIVQKPCYTTYVKPCIQTYQVVKPVTYTYSPGCAPRPACYTPTSYCW
ncbi:MAG: hypothetical protein P1V20_30850 [Verrucomicrobiales bacterium]|nr:hypothetical protein [Verrucomicrobiales bacterium]